MVKSYKMLVVLAMLQEGRFPGEISIEALTVAVERLVRRSPRLIADVGESLEPQQALRALLERNPIPAWTGGRGTGARSYFSCEGETFRTTFEVPVQQKERFLELTREIAEYRLAEYLRRSSEGSGNGGSFRCRVSQAGGRPILFLPARRARSSMPEGWAPVLADGQAYEANFVTVAVNVIRRPGSEENVLPALLRRWFGDHAGSPGTRAEVEFSNRSGKWVLEPVRGE
jgi:hypothetical protein